jgi:hypothetical protein
MSSRDPDSEDEDVMAHNVKVLGERVAAILAILRLFGPETYSIEVRHSALRDYMVEVGYLTWCPPMFGSNCLYCITEKGRAWRDALPEPKK